MSAFNWVFLFALYLFNFVQFIHHFVLTNIQIENQSHLFQVKFRQYFVLSNVQSANYFFPGQNDISSHLQMYQVNLDIILY